MPQGSFMNDLNDNLGFDATLSQEDLSQLNSIAYDAGSQVDKVRLT